MTLDEMDLAFCTSVDQFSIIVVGSMFVAAVLSHITKLSWGNILHIIYLLLRPLIRRVKEGLAKQSESESEEPAATTAQVIEHRTTSGCTSITHQIKKIGIETWKAKDGCMFQELEPYCKKNDSESIKITNLHRNCWIDQSEGSRVFEKVHMSAQHADSSDQSDFLALKMTAAMKQSAVVTQCDKQLKDSIQRVPQRTPTHRPPRPAPRYRRTSSYPSRWKSKPFLLQAPPTYDESITPRHTVSTSELELPVGIPSARRRAAPSTFGQDYAESVSHRDIDYSEEGSKEACEAGPRDAKISILDQSTHVPVSPSHTDSEDEEMADGDCGRLRKPKILSRKKGSADQSLNSPTVKPRHLWTGLHTNQRRRQQLNFSTPSGGIGGNRLLVAQNKKEISQRKPSELLQLLRSPRTPNFHSTRSSEQRERFQETVLKSSDQQGCVVEEEYPSVLTRASRYQLRTIETSKTNIDGESRPERISRNSKPPTVASVQNSEVGKHKAGDTYGEEPRSPRKQPSDEFQVLRCEPEELSMMFKSQCNAQSSPKKPLAGMTEVNGETETDAQDELTPHTVENQDAREESAARSLEFVDSSDSSTNSDGENSAHLERGDSADSGFHPTGMSSDEDDLDHHAIQEIPPELIDEINRVCREGQVEHWEIKCMDPGDEKKLFVFGHGIAGKQALMSRIAEKFDGFCIITREMEEVDGIPLGIFRPLVGDSDSVVNCPRLPFIFKTWEQVSKDHKRATECSTCELIVRGEDLLRAGHAVGDSEYWAVITAHHVLSKEQCVRLIRADPKEHNKIWNEICSPTRNVTYSLEDHQGRRIDVVGQPLFRFWHYAPSNYQRRGENNTTDKFLNDVLLFKLDSDQLKEYGWLEEDSTSGLCKLEVHTGAFSLGHPVKRYHEAQIKGIVPIRSLRDFGQFHMRKRLRVLVNNKIGHIVNPDLRLKDRKFWNEWKYGQHFQLKLEDGEKLIQGVSGSVVYTIDEADRKLYALGMLIGVYEDDEISGGCVYQAIALWPCLKQIEDHMKHRIKSIQIVGIDQIWNKEAKNVIPCMVSIDSGVFEK